MSSEYHVTRSSHHTSDQIVVWPDDKDQVKSLDWTATSLCGIQIKWTQHLSKCLMDSAAEAWPGAFVPCRSTRCVFLWFIRRWILKYASSYLWHLGRVIGETWRKKENERFVTYVLYLLVGRCIKLQSKNRLFFFCFTSIHLKSFYKTMYKIWSPW